MPGDLKSHWTQVYRRAAPHEVSWFEAVPERSLELILATGVAKDAPILDVGGGASTLVDHLLREGFKDLTVLDLAAPALAAARARLGPAAARVEWIEADATAFRPPRPYALWHDRAVFHFLTDPAERERYLEVLRAALTPGGHAVLATFGPKGPTRCSGLEVERYSADRLCGLLGLGFRLERSLLADHVTPAGVRQQFLYGWWTRAG
jgi:SAM-dependent methyltransferase